jgi:hypothetical protein
MKGNIKSFNINHETHEKHEKSLKIYRSRIVLMVLRFYVDQIHP